MATFQKWLEENKSVYYGYALYQYYCKYRKKYLKEYNIDLEGLSREEVNDKYRDFDGATNLNKILNGKTNGIIYIDTAKEINKKWIVEIKPFDENPITFGQIFREYVRYRNNITVDRKVMSRYYCFHWKDSMPDQFRKKGEEFSGQSVILFKNKDRELHLSNFEKNDNIVLVDKEGTSILKVGKEKKCKVMMTSLSIAAAIVCQEGEISSDEFHRILDEVFLGKKPENSLLDSRKQKNPYFYHFTSIDNFKEMLKNGGIVSKNILENQKDNLSNTSIQAVRSEMKVTTSPVTYVHDYVPFYFAFDTPMFYERVCSKAIDQIDYVFLLINIDRLREKNVFFTNLAANSKNPLPEFFYNLDNLDKVKWECINTPWYRNKDRNQDKEKAKREKMSEVLVKDFVPFEWVEKIYTFNENKVQEIRNLIQKSELELDTRSRLLGNRNIMVRHNKKIIEVIEKENEPETIISYRNYYHTKSRRNPLKEEKDWSELPKNQSLVTGPKELLKKYNDVFESIIVKRNNSESYQFRFENIRSLICEIKENFVCLRELEDIFELETSNEVHKETVSDHTKIVVKNIEDRLQDMPFSDNEKDCLLLSGYLHDIGKGPKKKWKDGKQPSWPDHPAEAIPMLERIFTKEIRCISNEELNLILLLVIYHDLLGEIVSGFDIENNLDSKRKLSELENLNLSSREFDLLAELSRADIKSLGREHWLRNFDNSIERLKEIGVKDD